MAKSVLRVLSNAGCGMAQRLKVIVLHGEAKQEEVLQATSAALGTLGAASGDGLKVLCAEQNEVPMGLTSLLTSEAISAAAAQGVSISSSVQCCHGRDSLPEAIGIRCLPTQRSKGSDFSKSEVEVLFQRGALIPAQCQKNIPRGAQQGVAGDIDVEVLQQQVGGGNWLRCGLQREVLTVPGDDGQDYPCESALLGFNIDSVGLLNVRVDDVRSVAFERAASRRRWRNRSVGLGLAVLLATAAWAAIAGNAAPGVRNIGAGGQAELRPRLTAFLREHNPSKLPEIENWLLKYRGREEVLIRRLETKYNAQLPSGFGAEEL